MPTTPEQKKAQSHTLGHHAFDANKDDVTRVKENTSVPAKDNKEKSLKEVWDGMTQRQRAEFISRPDLTVKELEYLDTTLGITKNPAESTLSATPSLMTIKGLVNEARLLAPKATNWLPTVFGAAGGWGGGAVAGAGAGPGAAISAKVVGSAIGGGTGEAVRQGVMHAIGQDDPNYTWGQRAKDVGREALEQGGTELIFSKLAKALRPTFDKSIDKIAAVGALSGASPLGAVGTHDLETVMEDLIEHAEVPGNEVIKIGDMGNLIKSAKADIGNKVDLAMMQPVVRGGKKIPLGSAEADVTPVRDRITSLLTAHPSEAAGKIGEDPTKFANIRARANKYSTPSTFRELTDHRIKLNNNLRALYDLPKGEQAKFLLEHPSLELDKIEADAIRDIIYPEMDRASGHPIGTTAKLQNKRGALMSLSAYFDDKVGVAAKVHAKSREISGTPWHKRGNFSTYLSSSGKPGGSLHRMGALIIKPNPEKEASSLVSSAFGNKGTTKAAKALTTPAGTEVMSSPLRYLMNPGNAFGPDTHEKETDEEQNTEPTQDQDNEQEPTTNPGVSSIRELREEAERRRPQQVASAENSSVKPAWTHIYDPISGEIKAV